MKKFFYLTLIILLNKQAFSQQDVLLSQYMFNHVTINPGYAGSKQYTMATALCRQQWVGWKGAPETNSLTVHGPIEHKNLGVGFSLMNDRIGVTNRTDLYGMVSYQLKLNHKLKLGLGLQGGGAYYIYKNSQLIYWDASDKVFQENTQTNLLPNFGTGAFLYSRDFYVGVSVPHMLDYNTDKSFSINKNSITPRQTRHYFGEAGAVFKLNQEVVLKPSVLVKYVNNAPVEADFNANVFLSNLICLGASYRTNDALVALMEIQLTKKLRLGYSYDFTLTSVKNHSSGSHEIMLCYDFGLDFLKIKSPRYF
jgi:type IX secretion system PorP/SprF family membrane protein